MGSQRCSSGPEDYHQTRWTLAENSPICIAQVFPPVRWENIHLARILWKNIWGHSQPMPLATSQPKKKINKAIDNYRRLWLGGEGAEVLCKQTVFPNAPGLAEGEAQCHHCHFLGWDSRQKQGSGKHRKQKANVILWCIHYSKYFHEEAIRRWYATCMWQLSSSPVSFPSSLGKFAC